ncbi:MAG TPA: UPF0164 family protein [Thermoanaerobaculia bacterium]|nr:UPF0164 family protein [Thermoanaerobaculia bacterium]
MRRSLFLVLLFLMLSVTPFAFAQNTELEALAGVQIDFRNPGARAMGMGGAFLALADDASAAEANPAGLTILRRPEVSLELRHALMSQEMAVTGVYPEIETAEFKEWSRTAEVQFASIVIPRGNWAAALYYHHPVNYTNSATILPQAGQNVPQFFFLNDPTGNQGPISEAECRQTPALCLMATTFPFFTTVEVDLKTAGLALAWKQGPVSLGVSGRYQRFREGAFTFRVSPDFQPASILAQGTLSGDAQGEPDWEDDFTFAAGFKWELGPSFSVGGVYKQGPEFPAPVFLQNVLAGDTGFTQLQDVKFHAPDTMGIGIAWRPIPVLTISADAVEVTYSNLTDNMTSSTFGVQPEDLKTDDVTEIHIGAEYFFTTRIPFAVRAGWWREPGHSMYFAGPLTCSHIPEIPEGFNRSQCIANRTTLAIFFPEPEDQDHISYGVGLAWPNFQIDAAYDTSDRFKVGSLSAVYRF